MTLADNAAISACASCGEWEQAVSLLAVMAKEGVPPVTVSYSAAITACANAGRWQEAVRLLDELWGPRDPP